ncbi:MAG: hypothetical protein U0841_06340 [Chloroflexia bacterium]
MSTYLDRFLNIPAARILWNRATTPTDTTLPSCWPNSSILLDRQQQVNEAGDLVARYLHGGGDPDRLLALLGKLLLRDIQGTSHTIRAAARQFARLRGTPPGSTLSPPPAISPPTPPPHPRPGPDLPDRPTPLPRRTPLRRVVSPSRESRVVRTTCERTSGLWPARPPLPSQTSHPLSLAGERAGG